MHRHIDVGLERRVYLDDGFVLLKFYLSGKKKKEERNSKRKISERGEDAKFL
jgi:hypothetical protein